MDNMELLSRLLIMWAFEEKRMNVDPTITFPFVDGNDENVIGKIIYYRTKEFNVKIPSHLGYIIAVCSNGNPGMSIIIYYTLLENIVKRKGKIPKTGYMITSEDFSMTFPAAFPDMSLNDQKNKFENLWDQQKDENGNNKVDTFEYWNKLFEPEA